jgi:NTP pyrophosphatase (non-canonical NTP hydrolase)
MDLNEITTRIEFISAAYADQYTIERTDDWLLLKLTEELGELIQAVLTSTGRGRSRGLTEKEQHQAIAHELADVIGMCLIYAHRKQIDVEQAITDKWLQHEQTHRERGFTLDPIDEATSGRQPGTNSS